MLTAVIVHDERDPLVDTASALWDALGLVHGPLASAAGRWMLRGWPSIRGAAC